MRDRTKLIIILSITVVVLAAFAAGNILFRRIPSNDRSVTGNTAGNLNNKGLFCESDGKIYFSNAYDSGCLYSMNADETDIKKLGTAGVSQINAGGNYLYYYLDSGKDGSGLGYLRRTYGIYRSKKDGDGITCLSRDMSVIMQLTGNYLYYQRYDNKEFAQLYKMKTNKTENALVSEKAINPAACHNGILYFNGTEKDHYLYAMDTKKDSISTVYDGNVWYPVYHKDYIYFMDVPNNYRLCRYSLSGNTVEILTNDRIDTYNVGDNYIYYQKNSQTDPALKRMRLDGSEPETIVAGNYSNINITSEYVYFNAFNQSVPIYHMPANGPVNVTTFVEAQDALLKK